MSTVYVWTPMARVSTIELSGGRARNSRHDDPVEITLPAQTANTPASSIAAISAGDRRCAVATRTGNVFAWGLRFGRPYDDNDIQSPKLLLLNDDVQLAPRSIAPPRLVVRSLACGDAHCLAIDAQFGMWACGSNAYGQLGSASLNDAQTTLKPVPISFHDHAEHDEPDARDDDNGRNDDIVDDLAGNGFHFDHGAPGPALAVRADDFDLALRMGGDQSRSRLHTRVLQIAAGSHHSVAIIGTRSPWQSS